LISATGNITGGNISVAGVITSTGNIVSTANVNSANVNATTGIYGNIFTTLIDSGDSSAITVTPDVTMSASLTVQNDVFVEDLISTRDLDVTGRIIATGNITAPVANIAQIFAGNISATGNVTANNIVAVSTINIAGAQVATVADAVALAIALG